MKSFLKQINSYPLWTLGIPYLCVLFAPLVYLYIRDGAGSAVFQVHDQLDETILNYYFSAKYFGNDTFEQVMCGLQKAGLKPFGYFFLPLYAIFDIYTAFLIQYFIVIITAFFGMYFAIKEITKGSLPALIAGALFSLIPFTPIYGNVSAGTGLIVYVVFRVREKKGAALIVPGLLTVFYALTTSFALSGWAAITVLFVYLAVRLVRNRKLLVQELYIFVILTCTYVLSNFDLFSEVFGADSYVSHRTEFNLGTSDGKFGVLFKNAFFSNTYFTEAPTYHLWIYVPVVIAIVLLIIKESVRKRLGKAFLVVSAMILSLTALNAFFSTGFAYRLQHSFEGILSSFNFTRFYYFVPGLWYILAGISLAVIIESFDILGCLIGGIISAAVFFILIKNPDGTFYQDVNQINNGSAVTGYVTMRSLYDEKLYSEIDETIGLDKSSYRIAHIGISPVGSLVNGFYTIDGYSNNYPLSYKHEFREIIAGELKLNEFNRTYFDAWGSRCYIFYHDYGINYMYKKGDAESITDMHLDFDALREMNVKFLFTAGEITDCEQYGLESLGYFETDESYFGIYVYEIGE